MVTAAWVLGCWCVASLAVAATWSAFRTFTKRDHANENALRIPQTGWGRCRTPQEQMFGPRERQVRPREEGVRARP